MESYVAAVFDTRAQAVAFHALLLRPRDGLHLKRAGVYGRNADGDVNLSDTETDFDGVFEFFITGDAAREEALDELNEKLPSGSYAVLAVVDETDPNVLDALAQHYGGQLYRRTPASLESAGYRRLIDSSNL